MLLITMAKTKNGENPQSDDHTIEYGRVVLRPKVITATISERRKEKGLSLRGLAESANVSLGTVVSLEQGNHNVQLEKLLQVLAVLDLVPQDLWEVKNADTDKDSFKKQIEAIAEITVASEFLTSLSKLFKKNGH